MTHVPEALKEKSALSGLCANLEAGLFQEDEQKLITELIDIGQDHLFADWDAPGTQDDLKKAFVLKLSAVNGSYPGGISGYIQNGRTLLSAAKSGENPFAGLTPTQPSVTDLSEFNADYMECENLAMDHLDRIAIVLVAGGLGERLGYSGIKLEIPIEVIQNTTYLKHYTNVIKAMQERMTKPGKVPLIIMTSEDTDSQTRSSFKVNDYYGLDPEQVIILKQELVPALADNDARLAIKDRYQLILKPHGHGDIHMLMHQHGVAAKLLNQGIQHLIFIQDTNGQIFNAGFAALGASLKHGYDFNFVVVNRIPGEAVGALTKLSSADKNQTLNVEYNLLDALLRNTVSPEGDVPTKDGFSMFPGSINILVLKLPTYKSILDKTQGIIAEFVNPKYADESKTAFKKPTRLETMMQDLPKLFSSSEKVGGTLFNRVWCFSADKNNIIDARAKYEKKGPPESAATAESDFYLAGRMKARYAGCSIEEAEQQLIQGIPFTPGPAIILHPDFALCLADVQSKLKNCSFSPGTCLILKGKNIKLENVVLTGNAALVIDAHPQAEVTVNGLELSSNGFNLKLLSDADMQSESTPEYLKIRGYTWENQDARMYTVDRPGVYTIDKNGEIK